MKLLPKLLLIFIPLVAIPSVILSVSVSRQANRIIRELVFRNAELELASFLAVCEGEVATLERLKLGGMDYYRNNARRSMLTYAKDRNLPWGFLFVIDMSSGSPLLLPDDLEGSAVSVLDVFEPWDWQIGAAVRNSYINSFLRSSMRESLAIVIVVILAAVLIIYVFVFYLVRHVKAMAREADRMSAGDLTARVEVRGRDEIASLGRSFNEMADSLQHLTANLEDQVEERTEALKNSLEELRNAQDQLIRRERLANLGGVVAGVAHEINTPLGVGITSASYLNETVNSVREKYRSSDLSVQQLDEFFEDAVTAADLILTNLGRARNLVANFKQLAVDQTVEEIRTFNLNDYVDSIIYGLHPRLKQTSVKVETDIDPELNVTSYPGFFYQIISNLIINSLIHGFQDSGEGTITITGRRSEENLELEYRDDGCGMEPELAEKAFEPFVTTRADDGGSGLGLNIVFNLVNRRLNGRIHLQTDPGEGVRFIMLLPLE